MNATTPSDSKSTFVDDIGLDATGRIERHCWPWGFHDNTGYAVVETDVIAVEVPDHPGGLLAVLKPLKAAKINVIYLYPFLGRSESGKAIIVIAVDKTKEAVAVLKKNWVRTFGPEIYAL